MPQTSSIGITVFGDQRESTDDILQQADIAMYQAKAAGRNTMRFFAPALQAAVNARAALEEDLRQAIKTSQFVLYYQPQVDATVVGAEALIRWNHPRRGIVLPGRVHSPGRGNRADSAFGRLGTGNRLRADCRLG